MIYPFGQYKYRQTTPTFMLPLCNLLLFSVTTGMNGDKSIYLCNMKLQMRLILIFVSLSVLGIFFFQGYWLWNSYNIEKQQIGRIINETLQQAINEDLTNRMEKMKNDTTAGAPHGEVEFNFSMDSTSHAASKQIPQRYYSRTRLQLFHESDSSVFQAYKPENTPMMRMAFKGIWQAINGLSPVDIEKVDSLWSTLLKAEGIHNAHFIDFTLGKDTLLASSLSDDQNPGNLLPTQKIGVNTDDSIAMRGFSIAPEETVIKQMGPLFLASFLLIIITTACYIYLIRTILRQKTIAQIKNDFVNNMTHELKTPITITYSAIDAMQTFNFVEQKETREEYFTLCRQQLKHLSGLVEKILSMAVDERKNFWLLKETFRIKPVIESLTLQFKLKAEKPVSFETTCEPEDVTVYADKLHFTNVISNMLDNSIKYSGKSVHISIRAVRTEKGIQIDLADNGIGIPSSQSGRIFERFYRVPKGNIHDVKGFGLGLSYVKDIIERHNGSISVESREKEGSTFTILIPEKK